LAGGQMSWMPTFVTAPPPTAAKSHDTGPDVLLIELLGGVPVWAETDGVSLSNNIKTGRLSKQTAAVQVKARMTLMSRPPRHFPSEEALSRTKALRHLLLAGCMPSLFVPYGSESAETMDWAILYAAMQIVPPRGSSPGEDGTYGVARLLVGFPLEWNPVNSPKRGRGIT